MKYFSYVPWVLLVILIIIFGLKNCEGPKDHDQWKAKYDSATSAGAQISRRADVLRKDLSTQAEYFKSRYGAAIAKSDSLTKIVIWTRKHPKVVDIIHEVPTVDSAFHADDALIAFQVGRIKELEGLDSAYKHTDGLLHAKQDSIISNFDYRNQILTADIKDLEKDLKKQGRAFSLGFNVGPGIVVGPTGTVHAGLAGSVGINLKIRKRH